MSAPLIQSVGATSATTVLITFDQPMLANAALTNPSNYDIEPKPPGDTSEITAITVGASAVKLTFPTDLLSGGTYTIQANGVSSKLGEVAVAASSSFTGIGTRPSFVSAEAQNKTTVRVVFDEPMDTGTLADPTAYSITSQTTGANITIVGAALVEEGLGLYKCVDLFLGSKMTHGQDHELSAIGLTDASGNPQETGDVAVFEGIADLPRMVSAGLNPANSKQLVLSFDSPMDLGLATSLSSYRIVSPVVVPPVYFGAATLSEDRRTVRLSVSESKNGSLYAAQAASFVADESGNELHPDHTYQLFAGVGEAPTFVRWQRVSRNRVDVYFSEPMLDGEEIRNPARYTFDNGASTVAVLAVEGKVVSLATTDITAGIFYTLTIS